MAVRAMMQQQMQIHQSITADGRPELLNQLSVELTDLLRREFDSVHERHATAQIDRRCDQRFFHRQGHVTVPRNPLLIAQRLVQTATKTDPDVLNRVMVIHMQITDSFNFQIEESMTSEQSEHVIEETHARRDFILAAAIEINGKLNLRFSGIAGNRCGSGHGFSDFRIKIRFVNRQSCAVNGNNRSASGSAFNSDTTCPSQARYSPHNRSLFRRGDAEVFDREQRRKRNTASFESRSPALQTIHNADRVNHFAAKLFDSIHRL